MITGLKLREFYENNGINYDAFLSRLMGKESLVEKYIKIFLADRTYEELATAVKEKDYDKVGKKAHTLKGIALNLDLKKLSDLCIRVIDSVHKNTVQNTDEQFEQLKLEYEHIVAKLQS